MYVSNDACQWEKQHVSLCTVWTKQKHKTEPTKKLEFLNRTTKLNYKNHTTRSNPQVMNSDFLCPLSICVCGTTVPSRSSSWPVFCLRLSPGVCLVPAEWMEAQPIKPGRERERERALLPEDPGKIDQAWEAARTFVLPLWSSWTDEVINGDLVRVLTEVQFGTMK